MLATTRAELLRPEIIVTIALVRFAIFLLQVLRFELIFKCILSWFSRPCWFLCWLWRLLCRPRRFLRGFPPWVNKDGKEASDKEDDKEKAHARHQDAGHRQIDVLTTQEFGNIFIHTCVSCVCVECYDSQLHDFIQSMKNLVPTTIHFASSLQKYHYLCMIKYRNMVRYSEI